MGVPVEVIESVAPLLVHRREIAADSGGPGRFRGGCGQYMEVGALTGKPYNLGPIFDRTRIPAEGYAGGGQGARGAITLSDGRGELQDKSQVALAPDERFTLQLPGGGGYYDPFTRESPPCSMTCSTDSSQSRRHAPSTASSSIRQYFALMKQPHRRAENRTVSPPDLSNNRQRCGCRCAGSTPTREPYAPA